MTNTSNKDSSRGLNRRQIMVGGAALLATPAIFRSGPAFSARPIKIGLVNPSSGPLATFGEPVAYLTEQMQKAIGGGIEISGKRYEVQLLVKDSQSNPSRAAEVTTDLIVRDKVDLLLSGGAPDTVNPVSDQAEVNGVPSIATACPWQPFVFGRNSTPAKPFKWTYLFCFGVEDIHAAFVDLWSKTSTNKIVGGLFANDADGNAWGRAMPPALEKAGFKFIDAGRYTPLASDFTAQITTFKAAGVEIITGTMIPPDFTTFWTQAAQQGFRPKVASIGKAFLFPSAIAALGDRAENLTCEVAWAPEFPYKSGLTGQNGASLIADYEKSQTRKAGFNLGMFHALFEVAVDVLKRSKSIEDASAILQAITETQYQSIIGPVDWKSGTGPSKNISKTPIVAGQWERAAKGDPLKLVIKASAGHANIPATGTVKLL